jgi:hypothetical protein
MEQWAKRPSNTPPLGRCASVALPSAQTGSAENAGRKLEWFRARAARLAPLPFHPSNNSDGVAALSFRH